MSNDFWIILLAAVASAWGARVAIKTKVGVAFRTAAVVFYLLAGMNAVLLAMVIGDGRFLPGYQFSPAMQAGVGIPPQPLVCLAALLAHLALLIPRPDKPGVLWPLPATAILVASFFVFDARREGRVMRHEEETGPGGVAYLTLAPTDDKQGTRIVIAAGPESNAFLRVLYVHETEIEPERPSLMWTNDGSALVFSVWPQGGARPHQLLAVPLTGDPVGELPVKGHDWPQAQPGADSLKALKRFRQAEVDVTQFVTEHGGVYVR